MIFFAGCATNATNRVLVEHCGVRSTPIVIDGDLSDWPYGTTVTADDHFLFFKIELPDPVTIQTADRTHIIELDFDHNIRTGRRIVLSEDESFGIDLELVYTPETTSEGTVVVTIMGDGTRVTNDHSVVDVVTAPTYASRSFEIRISRRGTRDLLNFDATSRVAGRILSREPAGEGVETLATFESGTLTSAAESDFRASVSLPDKPEGAVRVVSWNVWGSAPMKNPKTFGRILRALDPDVMLLQEWDDADEATLIAWYRRHVTETSGWHAKAGPLGVRIVSRHSLEFVDFDSITVNEDPVGFTAISVMTPLGNVLFGSTHLKCCGTKDSPEEQRRQAEATAITSFLRELPLEQRRMLVLGGDINLVGSRKPLDILASGLDADETGLSPARTPILGDAAFYTWTYPGQHFAPGRLDWLLYSDSTLEVVSAFVLDTARLSDAALRHSELERQDSRASDHLPVVVDVRRR